MEKQKSGRNIKVQIGITTVLFIVMIFLIICFYNLYSYNTVFGKGTTINGIIVAGLTPKEAEQKIKNTEYKLDLRFRNRKTEAILGRDLDLHYMDTHRISHFLDRQNERSGFAKLFGKNVTYTLSTRFSSGKLKKQLQQLPELQKQNMKAPKEAKPVYKEGVFVIQPEVLGTQLDEHEVYSAVKEAIEKGVGTLDMEQFYIAPKVLSGDEKLKGQLSVLNELAGMNITYLLPGGHRRVLDGTTLIKWLVKDARGIYKKDQSIWDAKLVRFVHTMKESVDTVYKERSFRTAKGRKIRLKGTGYYGWEIDEKKEILQLTEDLKNKRHKEREPVYLRREAAQPKDNYGFGNTYVEINLGMQHLWVYKKGKMVFETDVVSGKNDAKHRTPDGSFTVFDKRRNKMMRGDRRANGRYEYETVAHYWLRLTNSGVGLHDAPWRAGFGGHIWRLGGSHGCINLPAIAAQTLYRLVNNGMPVAVYY